MATGMGRFCASPVGCRGSQDSFRALHNMDRKYYQKSKRGKEKGRGSEEEGEPAIQGLAQPHERPKKQCHIEDAPWNTKRNRGLIVISGQTAKRTVALHELFLHFLPELPLPPSLRSAREGSGSGWELAALLYPPPSPSSSLWQVNWISVSEARSQLQEVLCSQGRGLVSESAPCPCQGPLNCPVPS